MDTPVPLHAAGARPAAMGSVLGTQRRLALPVSVQGAGGQGFATAHLDELRPSGVPWRLPGPALRSPDRVVQPAMGWTTIFAYTGNSLKHVTWLA